MEKTNLNYSIKNIPIANNKHYKMVFLEKIESLVTRMRWKAFYFDEQQNFDVKEKVQMHFYGLKSKKTAPRINDLEPFETDLLQMFNKLKFRNHKSPFQQKLVRDMNDIRSSDKIFTHADKTTNMYKLKKDDYDKILYNAVTAKYKKVKGNINNVINREGKKILGNNPVVQRMEINGENNCFFTLKDHKDNFDNNPTVRLINPAKNELGRISKSILENLNTKIRNHLHLNQWKNTDTVIEWFNSIKDKKICKFIVFDIKDFYPSINEKLLNNALNFANTILPVTDKQIEIIKHARKSLLFNNNEIWIKKDGKLFDVTMGAYDGAEVCELVGCYLLYLLREKFKNNDIGLYRDDGLAVFKNMSGPESEKIKKSIKKVFNNNDLDIIIQTNMSIVNFLDVTFNLNNNTYQPYHKPENTLNYINIESNHPPNIKKQLPINIESRLSRLSSNEQIFKNSLPYYEQALKQSGYQHNFKYQSTDNKQQNKNKRNRKRNIIWFNPPYNANVTTNIGHQFLNLVKKHFPSNHRLHKIFNKNNIKLSYSCMPNMKSIINAHNATIMNTSPNDSNQPKCNCINKNKCPMHNNCLQNSILYEANISKHEDPNYQRKYLGICETTFKLRYANHKKSFNHQKYQHNTCLSTEYWKIKNENQTPIITWKSLKKCSSYNQNNRKCKLCLNEKYEIATQKSNLLNKRSEIFSKCRHQMKYSLTSFDSKD